MSEPTMTGVMFDTRNNEFPRLREVGYTYHGILRELLEAFNDWFVVAHDPHVWRYADEDNEAMDETNWDAIEDDLSLYVPQAEGANVTDSRDIPSVWEKHEGWQTGWVIVGEDDALAAGIAQIGNVLAIAPDNEDALDAARELLKSLSDYPLLDESGYSEREYDAWCKYAPEAWHDEIIEARRDEDERFTEEELDALDGARDELLPELGQWLHYYNGFSGEYGPNFLDIYVEHRDAALAVFTMLTQAFHFPNPTLFNTKGN